MYIPPQLNPDVGLFDNQVLIERRIIESLEARPHSRLLDIGCGRGRIAAHAHRMTGAHVSGFNIDADQIANANAYANETKLADCLDFKVGDHHKVFPYENESFDGAYSIQALWPFNKRSELDHSASELFRVLKPGSRYSCSEYLLTPFF